MNPLNYLKSGTKISILPNYRGVIVKTNKTKDQFGLPINTFTVKYLEKYDRGNRKFVKITPRVATINYSFLNKLKE